MYRLFLTIGAIAIVFLGCQRPTPTIVQSPAPSLNNSLAEDTIPLHGDDILITPPLQSEYAPTVYQAYPSRATRNPPALPKSANTCDFVGEVWDYAGLDGCSTLVETTEGHLFNVAGLPQGYFLEAGSRIRFGFNYVEDGVSICMHEDAIIRITCIQTLRESSGFPRPIVCTSYDVPSQWIHELIIDLGATYVTRFPWKDDRLVYLFETPSGQYLYDCRGFLLCQPKRNCLQFIENFNLGKQIYAG